MTSLHAATMTKFAAKRYMDDILLLMQKEGWDRQRFYEDFKRSECYARPLNLEEATDGTFLETFFTVQHDHIDFRLKNVNEGEVKKVWRYQASAARPRPVVLLLLLTIIGSNIII